MLSSLSTIFVLLFAITYGDRFVEYPPEPECNRAGGMCMPKADCPSEIPAKYLGLCPEGKTKDASVECCHGISLRATHCSSFGGSCMSRCHENLQVHRAKDCPENEICCVLVL